MKAIVCTRYGPPEVLQLKEDFTKGNEPFDIIFDAVGKISYSQSKRALKPKGTYVSVVASGHAAMTVEDLMFLTKLVEAGKLKPVIDRSYPLEQIVVAHRKGNVVITVEQRGT